MEYMINISTYNCAEERCVGDVYHAFLDYAFSQANFFMLVFANYYGKGLPARAKQIQKELKPFRVKSRTNPSWPGAVLSRLHPKAMLCAEKILLSFRPATLH